MGVNDFVRQAVEHLRQIPNVDCICPTCKRQHFDRGEWATRQHHNHLCEHCGTVWDAYVRAPAVDGTIPNVLRAALTVLGRECHRCAGKGRLSDTFMEVTSGWQWNDEGPFGVDSIAVSKRGTLHHMGCPNCAITGIVPIDVSWMDAPQYQSTREGFLRDAARACGWTILSASDDDDATAAVLDGPRGGRVIVRVGSAPSELEAMMACLSRAWGMEANDG